MIMIMYPHILLYFRYMNTYEGDGAADSRGLTISCIFTELMSHQLPLFERSETMIHTA